MSGTLHRAHCCGCMVVVLVYSSGDERRMLLALEPTDFDSVVTMSRLGPGGPFSDIASSS